MISLVALSALAGIAILIVLRLLTKPEKIRRAKGELYAHVLEMRLYGDEPRVVLRAQRDMLAANARYLGLLLPGTAAIAVPFIFAYSYLDDLYGRRPLAPGTDTIVTATDPGTSLDVEGPVTLTSPPVHSEQAGDVSWRLRAVGSGQGKLRFRTSAGTYEVPVFAGTTQRRVVTEARTGRASVRIDYPSARLAAFGLEWPWEAWFLLFSSVTALALRHRFGVQF